MPVTSLDLADDIVAAIDDRIRRSRDVDEFPLRVTCPIRWLSEEGLQEYHKQFTENKFKDYRSRSKLIKALLLHAFKDPDTIKLFDEEIIEMSKVAQ